MKAISITNIERFSDKNIKTFLTIEKPAKHGDPKLLHMSYQATNKLFGELQLLLIVDESIPMTAQDTKEN